MRARGGRGRGAGGGAQARVQQPRELLQTVARVLLQERCRIAHVRSAIRLDSDDIFGAK